MQYTALDAGAVADAHHLSIAADWNQTRADWRRLIDSPAVECFGGRVDDDLVATATVATYDRPDGTRVGWVGMVLVDPERRRHGYGTAIVRRAMDWATDRLDATGLDATDFGRPLYRDLGFVDVAPVTRWAGSISESGDRSDDDSHRRDPTVERIDGDEVDDLLALDHEACRVDRRYLLAGILDDPDATGFVVRDGADASGFALLRPGREFAHLGPLVAATDEDRRLLLDAAARELDGSPVLVDAPETVDLTLERRGLDRQRELVRMTHGSAEPLLLSELVTAIAGFEWG